MKPTLHKYKCDWTYDICDPKTHNYTKPLQTIQVSKHDLLLNLGPYKYNSKQASLFLHLKSNSFIVELNEYTSQI